MRPTGVCAAAAVVLLALAGCGGGSDPDGPAGPASSTSDPDPTQPDDEVPTESDDGPVTDETDLPPDTDDGGEDGDDERVLEVGGPTLDNTFPTNPFALPHVDGSSCVLFTNRTSDITVTVRSVDLVNLEPPGDPGLVLGPTPSEHPQCANAPGFPGEVGESVTVFATCTGAQLEPDEATACPIEVRSVGTEGTDYTARLVLRLSASCTGVVGEPCDRLVGLATPTAEAPVTLVWEDSRRYSSCLVPRDRGGAEFLPEESEGRCPTDSPSESPSESPSGSTGTSTPDTETEEQQ
jgi:hypothetical protein